MNRAAHLHNNLLQPSCKLIVDDNVLVIVVLPFTFGAVAVHDLAVCCAPVAADAREDGLIADPRLERVSIGPACMDAHRRRARARLVRRANCGALTRFLVRAECVCRVDQAARRARRPSIRIGITTAKLLAERRDFNISRSWLHHERIGGCSTVRGQHNVRRSKEGQLLVRRRRQLVQDLQRCRCIREFDRLFTSAKPSSPHPPRATFHALLEGERTPPRIATRIQYRILLTIPPSAAECMVDQVERA